MMYWRRFLLGTVVSVGIMSAAWAQDTAALLVTARLQGSSEVQVGATVELELQVTTPTWFTQPPQLPVLNLPGAMVTPPSGQGVIVRDQKDGVVYNGLRYTYVLSPTTSGRLQVPALTVSAKVGPGGETASASSQPFSFTVAAEKSGSDEGPAANEIAITQDYDSAPDPLVNGGRVTRTIIQRAMGVQAMLLPEASLGEVKGFKRYSREPEVTTLTDGRGGFVGGQRIDRADYVAQQAGALSFPDVTMHWRDSETGEPRSQTLQGRTFEVAAAPVVDPPFSLTEDLAQLRHGLRWVPASWLLFSIGVVVLALALWLTWPWWRRAGRQLSQWAHLQCTRYQASEAWHWRAWRREAQRDVTSLSAFYRWLKVASGAADVSAATAQLPIAVRSATQTVLGTRVAGSGADKTWRTSLVHLSHQWRLAWRTKQRRASAYALPVRLNPPQNNGNNGLLREPRENS
ncbi:Protein BatD [Bordetella tumbae]|uniref:BatD family protein n=1 Tax=Bordetella tumbae TaxID=1649139 RepID=UPI0039EF88D8